MYPAAPSSISGNEPDPNPRIPATKMSLQIQKERSEPAQAPISEMAELLMVVDKALDQYGGSVKQVVYWNFEMRYGHARSDLVNHPEQFLKTLKAIFGEGAPMVEKKISSEVKLARGLPGENLVEIFKAARPPDGKRSARSILMRKPKRE
jgi:hypothetical protein